MLAVTMLAVALTAAPSSPSYGAAYQAYRNGSPMLVVVTASWCGPCQVLKGRLDRLGIKYVAVDVDRQPALASRIRRGRAVPEVVAYSWGSSGEAVRFGQVGAPDDWTLAAWSLGVPPPRRWTFSGPGTLADHLRDEHGVSAVGLTPIQQQVLHSLSHEGRALPKPAEVKSRGIGW